MDDQLTRVWYVVATGSNAGTLSVAGCHAFFSGLFRIILVIEHLTHQPHKDTQIVNRQFWYQTHQLTGQLASILLSICFCVLIGLRLPVVVISGC